MEFLGTPYENRLTDSALCGNSYGAVKITQRNRTNNMETATLVTEPPQAANAVVLATEKPEDVRKLRRLADESQHAIKNALNRYVALVEHIRDAQIMPKTVAATLTEAGYVPSRVAEVKKLAFCSNEIFAQWKAGLIGMKPALERARAEANAEKNEAAETGKDGAQMALGQTVKPAEKAKRKTEAQRFKDALMGFMAEWVPVAGELPTYFSGLKVRVNGAEVLLSATRKEKSAKV